MTAGWVFEQGSGFVYMERTSCHTGTLYLVSLFYTRTQVRGMDELTNLLYIYIYMLQMRGRDLACQ